MSAAAFTAGELRREAEKEVGYRKRVFARLVAEGKMLEREAQRRIAMMEQIAQEYRKIENATERLL